MRVACALIIGMAIARQHSALAGWNGVMNGLGIGKAVVNVRSSIGFAGFASNSAPIITPGAAMIPTAGYAAGAQLPSGASASTFTRVIGKPGYIWSAASVATGGDKTDNPEIENRITITPSKTASVWMESTADFSEDELSGTVRINTVATPGTALLLRGFEFTQGTPVDLNDLKLHGVLKWEMLLQGPFDLRDNDEEHCNALVIPFTIKTSPANLYFVSDGAAISKANDPPVPSATTRPFASGVLATLSATDDSTASDKIKIWVLDAATPAFKAGPFKVGDKLFLRRNPNQPPFSHPLSTPYTAQVQTKGQTLLIAEDDEGGVTNPGVPVP